MVYSSQMQVIFMQKDFIGGNDLKLTSGYKLVSTDASQEELYINYDSTKIVKFVGTIVCNSAALSIKHCILLDPDP